MLVESLFMVKTEYLNAECGDYLIIFQKISREIYHLILAFHTSRNILPHWMKTLIYNKATYIT